MSNVQRIAGALFAKVRHVDDRLAAVDTRLLTVDVRLAAATLSVRDVDNKLDTVLWLLDEQKRRNDKWFAYVLIIGVATLLCLLYMRIYGVYVAFVYDKESPDRLAVTTSGW